jgi:glyceraldehyde 3-phosphate dehydrogenase
MKPLKIGIAGLGRVGRGVLRANHSKLLDGRFDIRVICDVMPVDQLAYLMAHDTTYGKPLFSVDCTDTELLIAGKKIQYEQVDRRRGQDVGYYKFLQAYDLDVLIDATGTASIEDLHLMLDHAIAKKILCTNNIKGADISLVYGVNEDAYDPELHHIITSSTCTGNAFAPIAYILNEHFGIVHARVVTIHPLLSDQRALDGFHSTSQLGRACAASIIPTSTGVGASAVLVIPELEGRLDCLSYRVPTEIVSVIDVSATLAKATTLEECTELFEHYAKTGMAGIIQCDYGAWGHQRASIDYLGSEYSSVLLMKQLSLLNGCQLGLALMHDNEMAYCCRVLDILGVMSRAHQVKQRINQMKFVETTPQPSYLEA